MSRPEEGSRLDEFTPRQLLLNVYVSQGIFIAIAFCTAFIFKVPFPWKDDFPIPIFYLIIAMITGIILPVISIELEKRLPDYCLDDGGINERIFGSLSYFHILVLTGIIAFAEEWLFRGVLQNLIGLFLTSLIFSILHVRYIKKPVLFAFVTLLSFWLGYLYLWTDTIWIPFLAHFLIDFISGCWIAARYKKSKIESENGV